MFNKATYTFISTPIFYFVLFFVLFFGFNIFNSNIIYAEENATANSTSTLVGNSTQEKVRNFFTDIPVMTEIARCESGFRQFEAPGVVLSGGPGGTMLGVFQISSATHVLRAAQLGFDITTLEGNVRYARFLYQTEGTAPWISSFPCWNKSSNPSSTTTPSATTTTSTNIPDSNSILNIDLVLGVVDPQVLELQKLLNKSGFTVATDGPGSPGNETTKFGALTKAALKKFQCAKNITCTGDEYTTGFGFANTATRTALIAVANTSSSSLNNQNNTGNTTTVDAEAEKRAKIAELIALIEKLQKQLQEQLALENA